MNRRFRRSGRFGFAVAIAGLVVAGAGCSDGERSKVFGVSAERFAEQHASGPAEGETPWILVPRGLEPARVALSATNHLTLRTGSGVSRGKARPGVPNTGVVVSTGQAVIENGATLEVLYALGSQSAVLNADVVIREYARAFSPLKASPSVFFGTDVLTHFPRLFDRFELAFHFDQARKPSRSVDRGVVRLEPGTYARVKVGSRGVLRLESGVYLFDDLVVEEDGTLELGNAVGAIQVWIRKHFAVQGKVEEDAAIASIVFGYLGSETVPVRWPLLGTLIAPRGGFHLHQTFAPHLGAIFARDVTLDAGVALEHRAFELPSMSVVDECGKCALYADRALHECVSEQQRSFRALEDLVAACTSPTRSKTVCERIASKQRSTTCLVAAGRVYESCHEGAALRPGACLRLGQGWTGG